MRTCLVGLQARKRSWQSLVLGLALVAGLVRSAWADDSTIPHRGVRPSHTVFIPQVKALELMRDAASQVIGGRRPRAPAIQAALSERLSGLTGVRGASLMFLDTQALLTVPGFDLHLARDFVRDHHGPFDQPSYPRRNTGLQVLRDIMQLDKDEFDRRYAAVTSDNVADGLGFAAWLVRNADAIRRGELDFRQLARISRMEDFRIFGPYADLTKGPIAAILGTYDHHLKVAAGETQAVTHDRVLHLAPERQTELFAGLQEDLDRIVWQGQRVHAEEFMHALGRAQGALTQNRIELGPGSRVLLYDGGAVNAAAGAPFASWVAGPQLARSEARLSRNVSFVESQAGGPLASYIISTLDGVRAPGLEVVRELLVAAEREATGVTEGSQAWGDIGARVQPRGGSQTIVNFAGSALTQEQFIQLLKANDVRAALEAQ